MFFVKYFAFFTDCKTDKFLSDFHFNHVPKESRLGSLNHRFGVLAVFCDG